jgi:hypothetical protein
MIQRLVQIGLVAFIPLALLSACSVETDRQIYVSGDEGMARFSNHLTQAVYLGGCFPFVFEKLEGSRWDSRGAPVMCVWEGLAQPVAPGERVDTAFNAPGEPGTWRLSYPVGLQCDPSQPLGDSHCAFTSSVPGAPFAVLGECQLPEGCGPLLGMPNWLCPDGSMGGPTDRCLESPDGAFCFWEIRDCPKDW